MNHKEVDNANLSNPDDKIKQHFRLDSTIQDLFYETASLILWITPLGEASPDLTELLFGFSFPN